MLSAMFRNNKRKLITVFVLVFMLLMVWILIGKKFYVAQKNMSPEVIARDYAKQNDSAIDIPGLAEVEPRSYNPLKNVYWGDTHVHTKESFDATLFGTTATVEDAYRFAKGETLLSPGGELMQLSRPMDFIAITDHAESFGLTSRCNDAGLNIIERLACRFMGTPNLMGFFMMRGMAVSEGQQIGSAVPAGEYQPMSRVHPTYEGFPLCKYGSGSAEQCYKDSISAWAGYKKLADEYNEPGVLTTFAAYEYSPVMEAGGSEHRNVIFNGENLPAHAISSFDVGSALELWRGLEETCSGKCDYITIPHNMNKGWGIYYSPWAVDGTPYETADWQLRNKREPIAEMYQIKGSSECALGLGSTDEECSFGQVLEPCKEGELSGCAFKTSFARQGLKVGLQLEQELGFNPLKFGMIGSTDTHNSNTGDTEEWDFSGKVGALTSPAVRRLTLKGGDKPYQSILKFHTSGGLAAVWAEENTRDSIFSSMKRKEVYATSGTRITLRIFAGWGFDESITDARDPVLIATQGGVPMGGQLSSTLENTVSPTFFVWAGADTLNAPLQRIQMIKGWIDEQGETHEQVQDIACADGLAVDPVTMRCPDNGASVDTSTCKIETEKGAPELMAAWKDPEFDRRQAAFYYARVLQNPTCRWSTYDAIRLGIAPSLEVPATIRERAWSSPIWVAPEK
jgi:hypothetical protein